MKQDKITIDNRKGSKELLHLFPPTTAELGYLHFADFAFLGRGEDEDPVLIGIERKTITDYLQCTITGRFSGHQLPGLKNYYNVSYLVIEGYWRTDCKTGLMVRYDKNFISLGNRKFTVHGFWGTVNSIAVFENLPVFLTPSKHETVKLILSLHHWWTHKEYGKHRSHLLPQMPKTVKLARPGKIHRILEQLPDVGFERAREIAKRVKSVTDLCDLSVEDFRAIPGVGKIMAERIYDGLR